MLAFAIGATLGAALILLIGSAGRRAVRLPDRANAPGSWGRRCVGLGFVAGIGALVGTTLLVSGYWVFVGPPSSVAETGPELARRTLGTLASPFVSGLVCIAVVVVLGPALLYSRMDASAIRVHVPGGLAVWLGLVTAVAGFIGIPPLPQNAQAGILLLFVLFAGGVLYLVVAIATITTHFGPN